MIVLFGDQVGEEKRTPLMSYEIDVPVSSPPITIDGNGTICRRPIGLTTPFDTADGSSISYHITKGDHDDGNSIESALYRLIIQMASLAR